MEQPIKLLLRFRSAQRSVPRLYFSHDLLIWVTYPSGWVLIHYKGIKRQPRYIRTCGVCIHWRKDVCGLDFFVCIVFVHNGLFQHIFPDAFANDWFSEDLSMGIKVKRMLFWKCPDNLNPSSFWRDFSHC